MRIAVNARFLLHDQMEGYGYFTREVFLRLAHQHNDDIFYFYFDRPVSLGLNFPANVIPIVVTPKARHFLSFKWWFDVKIPLALCKNKIDVFVSPDGFCSLATRVPQLLVVHDLAFVHYPKFIHKLHLLFYKIYTSKFLHKARVVATVSGFSKQDIINKYGVHADKIIVVGSAAKPIFTPVDWEERENIKEKFAGGCEYFVYVGGIHPRKNLLNLLKAFSLFKKRQHTNMKLLVAGRLAWDYDLILEKLKMYKFRQDVLLLNYLPESDLAKLVAGAYALIYPGFFEGFGVPIIEAMQSGVPVITSSTSSMPEVGGNAALYVNPADAGDIANKMKILFKDEEVRSQMIKDGFVNAAKFSWQKTADLVWQGIQTAVTK